VSFGIAGWLNNALGQDVDQCSQAYQAGNIVGLLTLPGSALAKGEGGFSGIYRILERLADLIGGLEEEPAK
jgi:hypothetical protein